MTYVKKCIFIGNKDEKEAFKICEEKGSGIDKVIKSVELYQLPAPNFLEYDNGTKVIVYSYKKLSEMDRDDKLRACYQHACLQYVSGEKIGVIDLVAILNTLFKIEPSLMLEMD